MANIFFTGDPHFRHGNIIKYCNRPFSSSREMDETIISKHNSVVTEDDEVYILGDLVPFCKDAFIIAEYLDALNGRKYLVPGNHDVMAQYRRPQLQDRVTVLPNIYQLAIGEIKITLSHYSMQVWPESHYGMPHLFGHSHGTVNGIGRSMDVGVDTNDFYPYPLEEILDKLRKIPVPDLVQDRL